MRDVQVVNIPPAGASASGRASTAPPSPAPGAAPPKPRSKRAPPGLTTKAKAKERNSAHQLAIKTQRVRIGEACFEDVNVNLVFKANENFMCLKTAQNLRDSGVRMVGFPAGVRPFPLLPTGKATGAWRHSEVDEVALALDARKIPGQGLRFERLTAPYQLGIFHLIFPSLHGR